MSMLNASRKAAEEEVVKSLKVQRNNLTKAGKKRQSTRYEKYAEAMKRAEG